MTIPHDLSRLVPEHRAIVEAIRALYPNETDEQAIADTVAGESGLPDAIMATLRVAIEREAMADGLTKLIEQMTERKHRLEDGAKLLRGSVLHAIQEAGVAMPLRAPDMTVSIGRGKSRVVITDADALPDALCKIVREPDKKAIGEALKAGNVPGAVLGNPQPFLSIHRS